MGEVVFCDTDKFKELEKQKPIWQDPSKEVAKIFDGATKTGILDQSRSTGRRSQRQGLPAWPPDQEIGSIKSILEQEALYWGTEIPQEIRT
ncbi:hypothetical protein C2G38_2192768 [Gigaspora rosea]|uniref:Uncharacterized protein n=1 Tax=Gigaspora rosea TaxID=44941 RepID=A0A397UYP9_9GLOM|nr:hypothetical protein C2G38_2192768 [Gigaspora rosea]